MKNLFLILISCCLFSSMFLFSQNTFSQNEIYQRLDSVILIGTNEKIDYSYNELGQNTAMIHYNWSNESMTYEPDLKYEYSFNTDNLCVEQLWFDWYNNEFRLLTKTTFSYDAKNQLLLKNYYNAPDSWEILIKTDYVNTYDDNDRLISTHLYENRKSVTETREYRYEYTYDNKGNLITVIYYDLLSNPYDPELKGEFIYDESDYLVQYDKFYFHDSGAGYSNWHDDMRDMFTINNDYSLHLIVPLNYYTNRFLLPTDFKIDYMITEINHEHLSGAVDYVKKFYYSTTEITAVEQNEVSDILVYPNPATDYLKISNTAYNSEYDILLINSTGQSVLSKKMNNDIQIVSVENIPAGLYLLNIESKNGNIKTEKIIIK